LKLILFGYLCYAAILVFFPRNDFTYTDGFALLTTLRLNLYQDLTG
jgi:hypothetical protein